MIKLLQHLIHRVKCFVKTKSINICYQGSRCSFSHKCQPLVKKKVELCLFYAGDGCSKGELCQRLHKQFPCKDFHKTRSCYLGPKKCKFSHDSLNLELENALNRVSDVFNASKLQFQKYLKKWPKAGVFIKNLTQVIYLRSQVILSEDFTKRGITLGWLESGTTWGSSEIATRSRDHFSAIIWINLNVSLNLKFKLSFRSSSWKEFILTPWKLSNFTMKKVNFWSHT